MGKERKPLQQFDINALVVTNKLWKLLSFKTEKFLNEIIYKVAITERFSWVHCTKKFMDKKLLLPDKSKVNQW